MKSVTCSKVLMRKENKEIEKDIEEIYESYKRAK